MTPVIIGVASLVVIFGAALLGIFAARALPKNHLGDQTRAAVSVSVAVVGTLSALVLGLMISTASSSFSARSNEVTTISVDLIRMDRMMQRYGPQADDARAKLRAYVTAKAQELFPTAGIPPQTDDATAALLETLQDAILSLAPADEMHRWLRSQTLILSDNLAHTRWLLAEQAGSSIPLPFIIVVVFWLAIVFASFGLFAPPNGTAHRVLVSRLDGGLGRRHDDPRAGHTLLRPDPHFRRADAPRAASHTLMTSSAPRFMRRIASATFWGCVSVLLIAPLAAWAAMALWFRLPAPDWTKIAAAGAFALIAIATIAAVFTHRRWAALLVFALAFGGVAIWWNTIEPPADGDWAPTSRVRRRER